MRLERVIRRLLSAWKILVGTLLVNEILVLQGEAWVTNVTNVILILFVLWCWLETTVTAMDIRELLAHFGGRQKQ